MPIKRLYNNYGACKNCKARNKCLTGKQTHKTIIEYDSEMQKEMNQKNGKQEYKDNTPKNQALKDPLEYSKNNSK